MSVEGIKADPPKMFWAPAPAILMNLDGDPIWSPIEDLDLRYALNTNWDLFEHTPSKTFYLRYNDVVAAGHGGDRAVVARERQAPGQLLEAAGQRELEGSQGAQSRQEALGQGRAEGLRQHETGRADRARGRCQLPEGRRRADAALGQQHGGRSVSHGPQRRLLLPRRRTLVQGGHASTARGRLPRRPCQPDFKQIPVEHPRSRVLASVPGTRQATEAVLLASIPRTARVNKKELKAPDVDLPGRAAVQADRGLQGRVEQAVNTDKDIVKYGDLYYMCFQGVWFMSRAATGPWEVATTIPQEIYSIPASSPVHHVTYVTVEDDDDDDEWVTFAYVAAYTGHDDRMGLRGVGQRLVLPAVHALRCVSAIYYGTRTPTAWAPGTTRTPAPTGAATRRYGPYGGVGMGASYNPRTGTYARGAAAYGPYGSRAAGQAYNPRTGTYAQTRQGSNVYGNWGTSSVQRGDNWAQTAHRENYRTGQTTSGIRTSEGGGRRRRARTERGSDHRRPHEGGDVYAGRDGNVYRRNDSRRLGAEQRLRRLGTLGGHGGAAARSLHVRDDPAGRPARSRQRRAHPGKHADRGPRRLAKRWLYPVRCRELRRRRALARRRRPAALSGLSRVGKREALARLEKPYRVQQTVQLDQLGHVSRPAGLMAGAEPGAVVAVEVLVEEHVVAPVRIGLEFLRAAVDRAPSLLRRGGISGSAGRRSPWPPRTDSSSLPDPVGHSILKLSP